MIFICISICISVWYIVHHGTIGGTSVTIFGIPGKRLNIKRLLIEQLIGVTDRLADRSTEQPVRVTDRAVDWSC